jgi:error-prone DNA polymerase
VSYVELHAHSAFSFLDGASNPDEMAASAAELGYEAFALTDHDGVWGAMEFAQACKPLGVRPIVGAEVSIGAGGERAHLTLLVESADGWRSLSRLLTASHAETRPKPHRDPLPPLLSLDDLERFSEGLVCLSGCARNGLIAGIFERSGGTPGPSGRRLAMRLGERLRAIFGSERLRIELQRPLWRRDLARNRWLSALGERLGVACVATGNVHAHAPTRIALQDALASLGAGGTLDETGSARRGNWRTAMVSPAEMRARFAEHPGAVEESVRLAERLTFDLTRDLGYRYPGSEDPNADRNLSEICWSRFEERYAGRAHRREAKQRLEDELQVIRGLRLSGFFILHRDLLELAREVAREVRGPESARGVLPPGRGRGSSVSSIVCYLTGLSHVDPVAAGLFLGRFLNDEVSEAPDIDLDFPRDIRAELIPRIHERYGRERSALVAAFPTFRARGAIRELGKALGLPAVEIERVARAADAYGGDRIEADIAAAIGERRARSHRWKALVGLVREAWGLPRHLSQHPGGMVLSTRPLIDLCPVQPAAMEGRQMVQWDKDSCADAGFLKIDLLGLGMLSAVERCVEEVGRARGERLDLSRIPLDDPEVYEAIQKAETTGVFQIESRAQMQMLPRSLPQDIDDLTVQVALVRPGPIQGGAVHPYLDRKKRLREDPTYKVPYEHPCLEPILSDTLGAIVFQDQVIQVAMALAGFSSGEAEGLRRAMSRKRSQEAMEVYRSRFIEGAVGQGVDRAVAERVFEQIQGFSGFGFPKSHASAFGLLAYQSTWLRVHRGPEFLCSLLNEQPMGFYPPDSLIHESQRRGIGVLGVDVNRSRLDCSVEEAGGKLAVRVGLGYVTGLKEEEAERLIAEREREGEYRELGEFASRSGIGASALERLALAGACECLGQMPGQRRPAQWRLGIAASGERGQLSLPIELPKAPKLPAMSDWERVTADYAWTGVTLGEHPMALMRPDLDGMASTADLERIRNGSHVEIAGMMIARQRPATAKGVVFLLLEDEVGTVNVIVPPPVYERDRLAVRTAAFTTVAGKLERREGVINVVARTVQALDTPGVAKAQVRSIEPPAERETGRPAEASDGLPAAAAGGLAAVAPRPHSFGRRG